jgi:hypothetical protein
MKKTIKNHFLQIYKIKIYKSISSFSFLIIAEIQFTKIFNIKQKQMNIKTMNKKWFVNARAVPNNNKMIVK